MFALAKKCIKMIISTIVLFDILGCFFICLSLLFLRQYIVIYETKFQIINRIVTLMTCPNDDVISIAHTMIYETLAISELI